MTTMEVRKKEPEPSDTLCKMIINIATAYGKLGELVLETYNQAISEGYSPDGAKNLIIGNCGISPATVYRALPKESKNPKMGRPRTLSVEKVRAETELAEQRAKLITRKEFKDFPGIQEYVANKIKDKTIGQAKLIVTQTIEDMHGGFIKEEERDPELGYVISQGCCRENGVVTNKPEIDKTFDVKMIDLIGEAIKFIKAFTGRKLEDGEVTYCDSKVYEPMIEQLKKNLATVSISRKQWLAKDIVVVALICRTILDSVNVDL